MRVRTTYGREYVILGGPHEGNNGTFYVTRDVDDGTVELKSVALVEGLEVVEE